MITHKSRAANKLRAEFMLLDTSFAPSLVPSLLRRNWLTRLSEGAFFGVELSLTQLLMDQNQLTHMPPIRLLTQLHFL